MMVPTTTTATKTMMLLIVAALVVAGSAAAAGDDALYQASEGRNSILPTDCGWFINFKSFVGNRTDFDDYPWLVLLEYATPWGLLASCGGVLISRRHVLSAAHCVSNLGPDWRLVAARLGEYDAGKRVDCLADTAADYRRGSRDDFEAEEEEEIACIPEASSVPIQEVHVHESYRGDERAHDIAVVELSADVEFGYYVAPICLPSANGADSGAAIPAQTYQIAGWGRLAGRPGTNLKLRSRLSLANATICRKAYAREHLVMADDQFCAGGRWDQRPCVGDSGGPLMGIERAEDGSHRMVVLGLLTMDSRFCRAKGWPGIFTDVARYRDWIVRQMG